MFLMDLNNCYFGIEQTVTDDDGLVAISKSRNGLYLLLAVRKFRFQCQIKLLSLLSFR